MVCQNLSCFAKKYRAHARNHNSYEFFSEKFSSHLTDHRLERYSFLADPKFEALAFARVMGSICDGQFDGQAKGQKAGKAVAELKAQGNVDAVTW